MNVALRYDCDLAQLPPALAARFAPLAEDEAARAFVDNALAAPHGRFVTQCYRILRRAFSDYDAYGLLAMYPMHLLSSAQVRELVGEAKGQAPRRLLDIGAGDGAITACAAPLFTEVYATEASRVMRRRLRARGFQLLDVDFEREAPPREFSAEVVFCLNVLDRCARPQTLLHNLRDALAPGGRLVLSVPLPLRPHVQGRGSTSDPDEPLPAAEDRFELGAARLAHALIAPHGLTIERFCRAPYLCRGDADTPLYVLDAAIFVCKYG